MITKCEIIPFDDETVTGTIDKSIEYVNIEMWEDYLRIELYYMSTDKISKATNITKDEAIQIAQQILMYYNTTNI